MRSVSPRTAIHIGPGLFLTRGAGEQLPTPPGWRLKSGQKIIGSGMGATTLKLVGAAVGGQHYETIDADLDHYMEIGRAHV